MFDNLDSTIAELNRIFSYFNHVYYGDSLPVVQITIQKNSTRSLAYGWFTVGKVWSDMDGNKRHEINVTPEFLDRSINEIVGTMLHEMVHLYCSVNNIQDTSRGCTYHNKKFKEIGESHGIALQCDAKYGWTITQINVETISHIEKIGVHKDVFKYKRVIDINTPNGNAKGKVKSNSIKMVCPCCGNIARITKDFKLVCGDCNVEMIRE
jgi:hypothetical protein